MTENPSGAMKTDDRTHIDPAEQHHTSLVQARSEAPAGLFDPEPVQEEVGVEVNLPPGMRMVQAEWDRTLARIWEVAEVLNCSAQVHPRQYAYLTVKRSETTNVEAIERILFQNLLLAPRVRTVLADRIEFGADWLWTWRKAVPFKAEKVGSMSRLAPWVPRDQWTYRFNLIEVEE